MTANLNAVCEACRARIEGRDRVAFQDAFLSHVRNEHPDWPYLDMAIRNYADATQRLATPPEEADFEPWEENRAKAVRLLTEGRCFGYLAYVDGRPAAWVNASRRSEYARYRLGADRSDVDPDGPADEVVIGVSCFLVAPPYRGHGLPDVLLERVLADAAGRDVDWVEAYPPSQEGDEGPSAFLGRRALYERHGFTPVRLEGPRQMVVRRPVG